MDVAFLQQMCGINVVVIYGNYFLNLNWDGSGPDQIVEKFLQLFMIVAQLLGCFTLMYMMSKVGRKQLMQVGTAASCVLSGILLVLVIVLKN